MHSARWMAKAIYSLKVFLFRIQAQLDPSESEKLLNVCWFIVSCYVEAWFDAPYASSAPRADLLVISRLDEFATVHVAGAHAAKKFSNHLWYLSEELIGLAIFGEGLPDEEREGLAFSILNKIGEEDPPKRRSLPLADLAKTPLRDLGTCLLYTSDAADE